MSADDDDPVAGPLTSPTRATRRRKPSTTGAFAATIHPEAPSAVDDTLDGTPTRVRGPARVTLVPGTVLAGRYLVHAAVGQGGMGTVYSARDGDLDEDVALKLLRPDLAGDEAYRARLRTEVRLARRVSHPNVCRVHDLGVSGELVFVTMELVSGRTLRQLLAEMRAGRLVPFDLAQAVDVLVQLGSALTAAHRAGVIHRDVKPDNVILTDGRAVLTDFGVASRTSDVAGEVAGTPAYLAPEVLRHEPFDHKADVYALAVVAYEMLTGRPPFPARTIEAATALAMQHPPYPHLPDELAGPEVRDALDRVLARALAPDPLLRTPAIDRFTEAFALAARGASSATVAGSPGPPRAVGGDTTPPSTHRGMGSGTDHGTSAVRPTRRPEVRVATALVWQHGSGGASGVDCGGDTAERAERIVVDAGGAPLKIGPGEMIALFGVPRSTGDDADRAARAALALVAALGGGAGLDTARVMIASGIAGLADPQVADGAAALGAAAAPGEVLASAGAARQLAARFDLADPGGGGQLAGMPSEPGGELGHRRVVGVRPVASAPEIATFRARELAAVEGHLERSFRERVPVAIEIRGAAGAGKTRLREALVAAVGARREVEWLVVVASPVGTPAPLATLAAASPEWYDAATGGGAITDPQRRHTAARRWLEARATRRPVVVIIEDIQWADPSTCALLEHLRAGLDDVPAAIVTLARIDDGLAPPPPPPGVEVVTLGPLDDDAARQLARSIAPAASAETIAGVVRRAAGNPFFVEELAREIAQRRTSADRGTLTITAPLPASIEAVIQARLDHLPEVASQVALAAAVIGRAFWRSTVAALVPLDAASLDAALADLERRGVISAIAPVTLDDDRYQFSQGLVRDVAYARLPPRDRRAHHGQVARWLEAHPWGLRTDDVAMVLDAAHHREQAGDAAAAAAAYRRAGERCLAAFANGEAARALERAIALVASPDAALHEAYGDALAETSGPTAAEAAYLAAAAALTGDADTPPSRARLASKLAVAASRRSDHATAIERYQRGLALAAPGGALAPWAAADPRVAAKLFGGLGWTLGYLLGRVDEGHPLCERAVALLEGTPHRRELAHALSRLGGTYMRACRYADQLRTNQRNLDIGRELGDLNMQLTANVNLGVVHAVLGAIDDAIATTDAARALAARTGATASAGLAASNLAGYLIERGRLDEADAALEEALELIDRCGSRYILCESYQFQARIAAARGDLVAARHHAERSRALARELASPLDEAVATRILAQIAARAGDHAAARALIDDALAAAAAVDAFEAARTRAARARVLSAAGDPSAAALFAEARAELARLGARRELAVLEDVTEVR